MILTLSNREVSFLCYLSQFMHASARTMGTRLAVTDACARGVLVRLRNLGLVEYLPQSKTWEITTSGRGAIGA